MIINDVPRDVDIVDDHDWAQIFGCADEQVGGVIDFRSGRPAAESGRAAAKLA